LFCGDGKPEMNIASQHRLIPFLIVIVVLMLACQFIGAYPFAPTETISPILPSTYTPLITETHLPPKPTALPLTTTPTLEPNTFYAPESGLRVHYPLGWKMVPSEDAGTAVSFSSQDEQVQSIFHIEPLVEDQHLDQRTRLISEDVLTGFKDIDVIRDEASLLGNGQDAWTIVSTGKIPDGNTLMKINVTTAEHGSMLYTILTFGSTLGYDVHAGEIEFLLGGTTLESLNFLGIPREQTLMLSGGESTNSREYDPATTRSSGNKKVFSGLVSFDPYLNLVPDLAQNWEVSPDGMRYTFHLRENARFHDGRPVTAQDVIYSWERAADPKTESDTVLTYLGDIVGINEMKEGKSDHISGVKAIDDLTLQVTIDAPKPYFLLKLTYPTAFIVDKENVESGKDWFRAPNGTGPYKMKQWDRFKYIIYESNPDFYLGAPEIPYIIEQLFSGEGIRLYESGQVDMTGVYPYDVSRVSNLEEPLHNELINGSSLCTSYVVFDTSKPPFDDPNVRRAFTMTFNRQKYIEVVLQGDGLPAEGLYPPGLPGFNLDLQGLPFDPERARQLLAESKYHGPEGLPPIVYTNVGIGNNADRGTAALADMWQRNLGIAITIENLEPDTYYDQIRDGNHGQILDGGWCADYPDPENFADVLFHSEAQQNDSNYSNPELDRLLEKARVEQDVQKRIRLYQQAEQMIVDDAPVLFTTHGLSHVLVKPYIKGFVLTPIDIPIERYMWLEYVK
jgi:oligopeptide transport system substrate-binding protein